MFKARAGGVNHQRSVKVTHLLVSPQGDVVEGRDVLALSIACVGIVIEYVGSR